MESLRTILLNKRNKELITLVNDKGEAVRFEQVAVFPQGNDVFCILHPCQKMDGVEEDESVVFVLTKQGGKDVMRIVTNENTAIRIFSMYYDLLDGKKIHPFAQRGILK